MGVESKLQCAHSQARSLALDLLTCHRQCHIFRHGFCCTELGSLLVFVGNLLPRILREGRTVCSSVESALSVALFGLIDGENWLHMFSLSPSLGFPSRVTSFRES